MTTTPTYSDLLRDPRWQRKRLEIMQRDDFRCSECGAKDATLNVHHGYYEKGRKPWEYPDQSLRCLCGPCHTDVGILLTAIKRAVGQLPDLKRVAMVYAYLKMLHEERETGYMTPLWRTSTLQRLHREETQALEQHDMMKLAAIYRQISALSLSGPRHDPL